MAPAVLYLSGLIRYQLRRRAPAHRHASIPVKSTVLRFKAASLLQCSRCLLAPLASMTFIYAVLQDDRKLAHVAIGMGVAAIVSTVFQWLLAARARCPLCLTPVLAAKGCAKHRRARTFWAATACGWRSPSCSKTRSTVPIATNRPRWKSAAASPLKISSRFAGLTDLPDPSSLRAMRFITKSLRAIAPARGRAGTCPLNHRPRRNRHA